MRTVIDDEMSLEMAGAFESRTCRMLHPCAPTFQLFLGRHKMEGVIHCPRRQLFPWPGAHRSGPELRTARPTRTTTSVSVKRSQSISLER